MKTKTKKKSQAPSSLTNFFKARRQERQSAYLKFVGEDVLEMLKNPKGVSLKQYRKALVNNYERILLREQLPTNALLAILGYYLQNSGLNSQPRTKWEQPATTYDEALLTEIYPLLVKRLKTILRKHPELNNLKGK